MNYVKLGLSALLCITIAVTSCNTDSTATTPTNTGSGTAPSTPEQQKLLDLVNAARTSGHKCGNTTYPAVAPVTWNTVLETTAKQHSQYMNGTDKLTHTGSNGSNPGDRLKDAGYNWMTYGENIAEGYPTEEAVVNPWLESQGHCKNIMNPDFKEMGVATSGKYWTQLFGTEQ